MTTMCVGDFLTLIIRSTVTACFVFPEMQCPDGRFGGENGTYSVQRLYVNFSYALPFFSNWTLVLLCFERAISVLKPLHRASICTTGNMRWASASLAVLTLLIWIVMYFSRREENDTLYTVPTQVIIVWFLPIVFQIVLVVLIKRSTNPYKCVEYNLIGMNIIAR